MAAREPIVPWLALVSHVLEHCSAGGLPLKKVCALLHTVCSHALRALLPCYLVMLLSQAGSNVHKLLCVVQVRSRAVKRAAKLLKQDGSSKPRLKAAFDCFASNAR